ncbi:nicotinate-nucleotide adenylyltransferase [Alkalihalobacillus sp. 1P02AB]|uniref:nicotinate-nucleotide adenylyltransferase n=1 Tax=Alkalihalobacillus sp. 1P02AB TaxID=3132260 RepID=UPI0039A62188
MKRIGLFGGSFDPPHLGHMLMAQYVLEECELDEIWFVPVHTPPHKKRESMSTNEERLEMLEQSTAFEERFFISTIEFERKGISYTIETVKQLKKQHPNIQFYFIIGGDMIESLHTWKDIDELMEDTTFIGVQRPGTSSQAIYSDRVIQVETIQVDLSSTLIRERVKLGKSIAYMVPNGVESIIRKRGLYGDGEREST